MRIITKAAGMATGTAMGIALAMGVTSAAVPTQPAEAAQSDSPPCGYDVYRGKVYITSLGKAHGTAAVIKWTKRYGYDGKGRGIGTLVGTKHVKRGQTVTVKRPKHTKASHITVDIVKGKLTRNESHRKVWHCEPA